eukprot:CAMPEP_0197017204 /NCGR_PEP_ID=MMETSP1380-20130617/79415_1 /TAXON_ID=5936 /ORGANISM="Euplotes crassus, Strain CT5" /LENGTH=132 /DNA_ID=CAMNT_0042444281 /DNA_START=52 /DNA_END=450 /DNA_ORIENTATION=+
MLFTSPPSREPEELKLLKPLKSSNTSDMKELKIVKKEIKKIKNKISKVNNKIDAHLAEKPLKQLKLEDNLNKDTQNSILRLRMVLSKVRVRISEEKQKALDAKKRQPGFVFEGDDHVVAREQGVEILGAKTV